MGALRKVITVGSMDRQITLQRPTSSRSTSGQVVQSWSDVEEVWAARDYGASSEDTGKENYQQLAANMVMWTVRKSYSYKIRSTWRISYDGDLYQIEGPPQEVGRRYIRIRTLLIDKGV